MRCYSHFCSTLHDEPKAVGFLSDAHYSVLRAVLWDKGQPQWHDFAVVWDGDHDIRILWVIEQLYLKQLLRDVLAIGERKGSVTIITTARQPSAGLLATAEEGWCPPDGDYFSSYIEHVDAASGMLINVDPARVRAYVKGIDALWRLGTKPIEGAWPVSIETGSEPTYPLISPEDSPSATLIAEFGRSLRTEQVGQLVGLLDTTQKLLFMEMMCHAADAATDPFQ